MTQQPESTEPAGTGFRCGYAGLCGRPNVGKSTLLNRLLGQKLSITSRKPNTTRWHVLGIKTTEHFQILYRDMPGLRDQHGERSAMQHFMHREVAQGLLTVDVIVMVVEALRWTAADDYVLRMLADCKQPVYVAVNKIDRLQDREKLLPYLEQLMKLHDFAAIIPLSAKSGDQVDLLENELIKALPVQAPLYPEDQLSDRQQRFFIAEFLREQLVRFLGDELPYRTTVTIEQIREEDRLTRVHALIWVESDSQKAIVIGKGGEKLKQMATAARKSMEIFLGTRVNLQTWVKVRAHWSGDIQSLREFGYE